MRALFLALVVVWLVGTRVRAEPADCVALSFSLELITSNPAISTAFDKAKPNLNNSFSDGLRELYRLLNQELSKDVRRPAALTFGTPKCRKADLVLRTGGTPRTHSWIIQYKKAPAARGDFAETWNLTTANPIPADEVIAELRARLIGAAIEIEKGLMSLIANDPVVKGAASSCPPPETNCAVLPSMNRFDGWLRKSSFELRSAQPEDDNVKAEGKGVCATPLGGIKVKLLNVGQEYNAATWVDSGVKLTNFVHPETPVCRPSAAAPRTLPAPPASISAGPIGE